MRGLLLVCCLTLPTAAQPPVPPAEEKGPYLGVLVAPIPEPLLDHLPHLPRDAGVLVTHVLPDSPAASAGLRKHDLLLAYNAEKVRDPKHLTRLIQNGKPGQNVRLDLVRAGRETSLEVKLRWGPLLEVAREDSKPPPGMAKPGGPPAVRVTALPVEGNSLQITFEYANHGRLTTASCSDSPEEIDREIAQMPRKLQSLARLAVQQIRKLELKSENAPRPR